MRKVAIVATMGVVAAMLGSPVQAQVSAPKGEACMDEKWDIYNYCLMKSVTWFGKRVCDIQFEISSLECIPVES